MFNMGIQMDNVLVYMLTFIFMLGNHACREKRLKNIVTWFGFHFACNEGILQWDGVVENILKINVSPSLWNSCGTIASF